MNSDFIDINFLPDAIRPRQLWRPWQRSIVPGLLLLLLALGAVGTTWLVQLRNQRALTAQRAQLELLGEQVQQYSVVAAEIEVLQEQVTLLATQAERLEADAERVTAQNPPLSPFLLAVTDPLLPRMAVTGMVSGERNRFLVQGTAGSTALVIQYADLLEQRPEIRKVTPLSIDQLDDDAPPGTVRWTLEVQR